MPIPREGLALLLVSVVAAAGCQGSPEAQATTAAAGGGEDQKDDPAEEAIAIELGRVTRESLSAVYSTSATLRADKQATVTARTSGVLRELRVEEGAWVEADQILAVLEDDEQRIAFEQAAANRDNQVREHERAQSLHSQGLISDEAYETIRREAVDAEHAAELVRLTLSRTKIRAPFAGRVLTRYLDVGAMVGNGSDVYELADLRPLYADVQVPERQVQQLSAGQTVRIAVDDGGEQSDARIERIAPRVDPGTGTVKVTVAIKPSATLRPGSFVRVGIVTDTHDNAVVVPRSALVADGRRWHLFRVSDDDEGKVELVEVTRGFEEGNRVEITGTKNDARELVEGDRIVVVGASSLNEGSAIQVMNEDDSGAPRVAA